MNLYPLFCLVIVVSGDCDGVEEGDPEQDLTHNYGREQICICYIYLQILKAAVRDTSKKMNKRFSKTFKVCFFD